MRLEPDRIFVRDGKIWSSAGITAGVDLALALIAEDLGEPVARRVAQQLVVYRRRPGGQSQFSALLEMERPEGRFGPLLGWARERLGEPLTVERLAERAAMSPRNFARRFAEETGVTPARAVERLRVEAARERVEGGRAPIEAIAAEIGFGDSRADAARVSARLWPAAASVAARRRGERMTPQDAAFIRSKPRARSSFRSSMSSSPTENRNAGPPGAQRVAVR